MTTPFKPASPEELAQMTAVAAKVMATVDEKLAQAAASKKVHFAVTLPKVGQSRDEPVSG